jgi:NADH-quinone oxidoreductase subunit L
VVTWVGALTALFAATIAVGQYDIKKVLAYSTISQLGFMVAAVGMGAFVAGMFHLITHAFFKALLFLSAGSVILGVERGQASQGHHGGDHEDDIFDPQDMRNMGGLQKPMPVTFWVYLAGALALAGIAPLAGFFSKDEILAAAASTSPVIFAVLLFSAFLTAFYMGRQLLMIFSGKARTQAAEKATESPVIITVPLVVLAVLSVLGGAINLPGVLTLEKWLEHTLGRGLAPEFSLPVAFSALVLALLGLFFAWLVYGFRSLGKPDAADPLKRRLGGIFTAMNHKWWVDEFYHLVIIRPYCYLSQNILAEWFDQEVIDGGANDLGNLSRFLASAWSRVQNGFVRTYALVVLLGVVAMLAYLLTR